MDHDPLAEKYSGNVASIDNERRAKYTGTCPVCGKRKLDVTAKPPGSSPAWWVNCWVCGSGREYLRALAEAVGAAPWQILEDPLRHLAPWLSRHGSQDEKYGPRPSEALVDGQHSALLSCEEALRYLTEQRGLTMETIEESELGYDREAHAITFPIRDETGALTNIKRRTLTGGANAKRGLRRPAALYPSQVLTERPRAIVLCEGEPDALLLNQHGIPAVTSSAGTNGWEKYPEWSRHFVGRRVAVVYDAGSYSQAETRALALRASGAREAWPVDLSRAGLSGGEDVGDWFVQYRRSAEELRAFINEERRHSRRRRVRHGRA